MTSLMYSYQARISVISPNLPSRTFTLNFMYRMFKRICPKYVDNTENIIRTLAFLCFPSVSVCVHRRLHA